jgi:hypothetical protein
VPSVALGNFTWDWIYEGYPQQVAAAPDLLPAIRSAYATASVALRLPMCGGFAAMQPVTRDIPFVARHSRRDPADVRAGLRLPEGRPLVLMSFGGHGLADLDTRPLAAAAGYTFITTDMSSPTADSCGGGPPANSVDGSLVRLSDRQIYQAGYRYEDLVRAADVVVTKPGYGIIAEAIANDTAILYTERGSFAEYDVLVRSMPRFARCRFIDQADLLAGRLERDLDRLLGQPPPPEVPATDGAEIAAGVILDYVG